MRSIAYEIIRETMLAKDPNNLPRKRLEQIRGFLIYIGRTYRSFAPYIIGLHMTIDIWRRDRDRDGWKRRRSAKGGAKTMLLWDEDKEEWCETQPDSDAPDYVSSAKRFKSDVRAMKLILSGNKPRINLCEPRKLP